MPRVGPLLPLRPLARSLGPNPETLCTLILLDRVVPGGGFFVAANRDEFLDRAASPPSLVEGKPAFVAPRDLKAGGTWMGVNSYGLFVGVTNRPTERPDPGRRSRGLLVADALRDSDPEAVAIRMSREVEGSYSPFNLVYADGRRTFITSQREDRLETAELPPGIHVLCNRDINDLSVPKVASIRERLAEFELSGGSAGILEALQKLLGTHATGASPLESVCVHTADYGTRSSSVLEIGPGRWRYRFADGAPCDTDYRDCSSLLEDLRAA
ncbi:MAG: NRDE family protein [Myxococcota bacterium]|nr:NRDE family protein [Myxococcota bacterium]